MGGGDAGRLDARALDALLRSAPRVHRPLLVGLYLPVLICLGDVTTLRLYIHAS